MTRTLPDFIDGCAQYLSHKRVSPHWHEWAGIGIISGLLGRHVWAEDPNAAHPEFDAGARGAPVGIILAGVSGSGKSPLVGFINRVWEHTQDSDDRTNPPIRLASDSMTHASFFDELGEAARFSRTEGDYVAELALAADEIAEFFPEGKANNFILSRMGRAIDCHDKISESRRYISKGKGREHRNVAFTLILGAQPGFMEIYFNDAVYLQGFPGRCFLLYAPGAPDRPREQEPPALLESIKEDAVRIGNLAGAVHWDRDAWDRLVQWEHDHENEEAPHTRLQPYYNKRPHNLSKLALICSISRSDEMRIRNTDMERALRIMGEAESRMIDVMQPAPAHTDAMTVDFIRRAVLELGKAKLRRSELYNFLYRLTPAAHIDSIVSLMCNMGHLRREGEEEDPWYVVLGRDQPPSNIHAIGTDTETGAEDDAQPNRTRHAPNAASKNPKPPTGKEGTNRG